MKQNLGLEQVKLIKKMNFSIEKEYKQTIIGNDVVTGSKTYTLLPNFVGKSESYARGWLANNGLSASVTTKVVSSGYYDGQIISQGYPEGKRTDLISGSVTLTVAKVKTQVVVPKEDNNTKKEGKKEQVIIDEDKKQEEEKEPTPDKDDLNDDNPEQ